MTRVKVQNVEAVLTGNEWACNNAAVLKLLRVYTSAVVLHGAVPDVEAYIVQELARQLPVQVVSVSPPTPPARQNMIY
jgi:hypothetical protein